MTALVDLVSPSRRTRLDAVHDLPADDDTRFALRRVLYTDRHAEVRAAAARRLGHFAGVESFLLDALDDSSSLVRDAILRALSRAGTTLSMPRLRVLVERDQMWWIRRTAIYALASIAGDAELPTFTRALGDPFWRVRHAAVKVLAVLGARDPDVRDEVLAQSDDSTTLAFLRASWGPVAIEAPARAQLPSLLPPALLDPDPAVVTARLLAADFAPLALVELLCDPHVPLRSLAARRIAASGDRAALIAALDWLEEPRIPHVVDQVHYMLDGLGDAALALAEHALARSDRPGAAQWAIRWVITTHSETLFDAALDRARADTSLRRAALRLATDDELVAWAADPFLVDAIAIELHERRRASAHDALLQLPQTPRVRALQLDVAARRGEWDVVERGLADEHHAPRAIAARWCVRRGIAVARDADPTVREAALTPERAAAAFADERDPWVRRAAIEMMRANASASVSASASAEMLRDPDAFVRAHACALPIVDDAALAQLLANLGDKSDMVRAAALDAMQHISDDRLRALLAVPTVDVGRASANDPVRIASAVDERVRRMAMAWLARALDNEALARLAELEPRVDQPRVDQPRVDPPRVDQPRIEAPMVERRAFGRAGFDVAPLAISGAYDLSPRGLAHAAAAGVDLYFWEPGYDVLAKFLRARSRRELRVITGSYHADAASIRTDVERALRKLRRETLDAFLLFWTRSAARVDDAAFAILDELKREGKIRAVGFSTHHRELARAAIEERAWDVVMIRHSAAHPGIETALLPTARERGTAIVTFSALCYGRMISGPNAPSASECYRYSLSQAGVMACVSAPRRFDELAENLAALREPRLGAERMAELRAHGERVHAESARFNTLVRQPTRDAAAAAREMLASEPAPVTPRLPRPSRAKRSRTRLGRR